MGEIVGSLAHGVDIVEVARIRDSIEEHGERFLDRVFTAGERAYCDAGKRRFEHYAARFAAKEAVFKALGTGWRSGIAWTDAEVVRTPSGEPTLRVVGRADELARRRGITVWLVSLSHTESAAIASVIGIGDQPPESSAGE